MDDGAIARFGDELTASLSGLLAGRRDETVLKRALAACATAAETLCAGRAIACGAGCPYCCVLNVAILLPEGLAIAAWLRERLAPAELADLRARLAAHVRYVRWMDDEERIVKRAVCPFLDAAGGCAIHPVRPLVCRAVSSFDRDDCREAFDPVVDDRLRTVPADQLRQAAYDAGFTALARALRQRGLDDRSIELGRGLLAFLEEDSGWRELFLSAGRLPCRLWEE